MCATRNEGSFPGYCLITCVFLVHRFVHQVTGLRQEDEKNPEHEFVDASLFSRALFWVSPVLNFHTLLFGIAFGLIPLAALWVLWLYPPGKYYFKAPPPPDYVGHTVMNITARERGEADAFLW